MAGAMHHTSFVKPPVAYRSVPFYSLNDKLEPQVIREQLTAFRKGGFGGAYFHSRSGLLTEYFSEAWWQAIDAGVQTCDELGMEAWFYDEDRWPSGFSAGYVPRQGEEYRSKALVRLAKNTPIPSHGEVLSQDERYYYVCLTAQMGVPRFNGTCWVDLLHPGTVEIFIRHAYESYANRYKDAIGRTAKGIFTDEPQIGPRMEGAISYSPVLREKFMTDHGYDVIECVGSLFEDVGDYKKVRLDYYRSLSELFEESFSRQIGQFCKQHGMVWTGHYNGEDTLASIIQNAGNLMMQYRHMERPGIDHLGLRIAGGLLAAKSLSSVANQYGQERRLTELFGISGQNMSFEDRKWIADWHAVLGINHYCPHLSLYSMKGCRKRDYPPTFSPQQPYWSYNTMIEDYMARISYATTCGEFSPEFLVLHPLESAYLDFYPAQETPNSRAGLEKVHQRSTKLEHLLERLMSGHREFDLGDEHIMEEIARAEDGVLQVGRMRYKAVILPYMHTIRKSTLRLLKDFVQAGGTAVVIGEYPSLVDGVPGKEHLQWMKASLPMIELSRLHDQLAALVPPEMEVSGEGSEQVWVHRRTEGSSQWILLTNTSREHTAEISLTLTKSSGSSEIWDPVDGKRYSLDVDVNGSVNLQFNQAQTLIVKLDESSEMQIEDVSDETYCMTKEHEIVLTLDGAWKGRRLDDNVLTLDFARYSLDEGKTFSRPEPVIGIYERLRNQAYHGSLVLEFSFEATEIPQQCSIVLEQPNLYRSISINGQSYPFQDEGSYRDIAFRKSDVTSYLNKGQNKVTLSLAFVAPEAGSSKEAERYGTEIESIYLIGSFGVEAIRSEASASSKGSKGHTLKLCEESPVHRLTAFTIRAEKETFEQGDLVLEGYPFYAGAFEMEYSFTLDAIEANSRYVLVFPNVQAIVLDGQINGTDLTPVAWSPWEMELTGHLVAGENKLQVTMVNSLRNMLGPHHHIEGELTAVGPDSFTGNTSWTNPLVGEEDWYDVRSTGETKIWTDDYHMVPFGWLEPPLIVVRHGKEQRNDDGTTA